MEKAASIQAALAQANKKTPKRSRCLTCQWLLTLSTEDAQAVQTAVFSGEWELSTLADTLRSFGYTARNEGLQHHARKQHQIPNS